MFLDLLGRNGLERQRAAQETLARLSTQGPFCTTRFNVAELYVGAELGTQPPKERERVEMVLRDITVTEFDDVAAKEFARATALLRRLGRPSGVMDVLIAAVVLANGLTLVTRNMRHFADIPGIHIETY